MQSVRAFIEAFYEVSECAKDKIIMSLGELKEISIDAVPLLLECLNENEKRVIASAIHALGLIGDKRAIEPLIEMLDGSNSESAVDADALGKLRALPAVPRLIQILNDPNDGGGAAIALGQIGDSAAVLPLIDVLRNKKNSSESRSWAVFALGLLGCTAEEAIPYILEAKEEPEFKRCYQDKVRMALARIREENSWAADASWNTYEE
jgi:HEAT repeat protein